MDHRCGKHRYAIRRTAEIDKSLAEEPLQRFQLLSIDGASATRIDGVHPGPLEKNLLEQRIPILNIGFAYEARNQRLELSARVPNHGLMEVIHLTKPLQIGQRSDVSGNGKVVHRNGVERVPLKPHVLCGTYGSVRPGETPYLSMLVSV